MSYVEKLLTILINSRHFPDKRQSKFATASCSNKAAYCKTTLYVCLSVCITLYLLHIAVA